MDSARAYYQLAKPGIIYGNLITAAAGFFLATQAHWFFWGLIEILLGLGLVIGSACVLNNCLDREIDEKMERTSRRALVTGKISVPKALVYAVLIGGFGYFILIKYTNWPTVISIIFAQFFYVVIYGIAKRRTTYSTLIGAIPGAVPLVAGYLAVTGRVDKAAIILFLILFFWQIPHFYAIGIFRHNDYRSANLPILPVIRGVNQARLHILVYILLFIIACASLNLTGYTGMIYLITTLIIGLGWLGWGITNYKLKDSVWGKKMFHISLIVNLSICFFIAAGAKLP